MKKFKGRGKGVPGAAAKLTKDTLYGGRLVCRQYKQGYRFSIDAVLAAHFCRPGRTDRILDLGAGSGIIGLILAFRHPAVSVTGLEFQPDLVCLARDNVDRNNLARRFTIIEGDLRDNSSLLPAESFDLVVGNPPYRQPGRGRVSQDDQRARARHEIDSNLDDVVRAAALAVKNRGPVVFVYPAARTVALLVSLKNHRLEPKRLQPVYSYPGARQARLILVEAMKNGGEDLQIMAPFFIYTVQNGHYSAEMQKLYE